MPAVPHYPSDEPANRKRAPDFDEIIDRILNDDGTPRPPPISVDDVQGGRRSDQ